MSFRKKRQSVESFEQLEDLVDCKGSVFGSFAYGFRTGSVDPADIFTIERVGRYTRQENGQISFVPRPKIRPLDIILGADSSYLDTLIEKSPRVFDEEDLGFVVDAIRVCTRQELQSADA